MKHSCHEGETLSTLTVAQEDVKQQLHMAVLRTQQSGYPASQN